MGVVLLEVLLLLLLVLHLRAVEEVEVVVVLLQQSMVQVLQVVPLQGALLVEVQLVMLALGATEAMELQQTALATRQVVPQQSMTIRMPSDASVWKQTRPRMALAQ